MTDAVPPLPHAVVRALEALRPSEEIASALTPGSRAPGSLHHTWAPVTEVRLRLLTGFPPPRLWAQGVVGRREVLAVAGRDGEPDVEVDQHGRLCVSCFAVFSLPREVHWRQACVDSVLHVDLTSLYVQEADDRPWPQSLFQHRLRVEEGEARDRPETGGDVAVVEVDGVRVGIQTDRSGAVAVGWSIRRPARGPSRSWNVTLSTRGSAAGVVQQVREAGLLR